jgi:hypothetical protein
MTQHKLKLLSKLLVEYAAHIGEQQPLAAQILRLVVKWVDKDIK